MNQQPDDPLFRQLARLAPVVPDERAQRQRPRALSLSLGPSSAPNASTGSPMAVPLGGGRWELAVTAGFAAVYLVSGHSAGADDVRAAVRSVAQVQPRSSSSRADGGGRRGLRFDDPETLRFAAFVLPHSGWSVTSPRSLRSAWVSDYRPRVAHSRPPRPPPPARGVAFAPETSQCRRPRWSGAAHFEPHDTRESPAVNRRRADSESRDARQIETGPSGDAPVRASAP